MKIGILLSALAAIGCGKKPVIEEPLCGGVTDKTDPKAPKVIESKEITDYYAHFLLQGEWSEGHKDEFYTFSIKKDDAGNLTVSENTTGVSAPADSGLLTGLQEIIDTYKLASDNGEYRTTAGLPPEFWPCTLTVNYASGEKLTFTHDNNPDAAWAGETYLLFADWFAGKGEKALCLPVIDRGRLIGVNLEYHDENNKGFWYFANEENEDSELTGLGSGEKKAPVPEDFYDRVTEIVSHYDIRPYDSSSPLYWLDNKPEDHAKAFEGKFRFVLFYENGDQFNLNADSEEIIEYFRPLTEELRAYFDSLLK